VTRTVTLVLVDRYDAGPAERLAMLADLHAVQVAAAGRVDELLAAGVPDLRVPRPPSSTPSSRPSGRTTPTTSPTGSTRPPTP